MIPCSFQLLFLSTLSDMKAAKGVPVIAKGVASCPAQAAAYGRCIAASYKDVQKDMCQKEFVAFKQCVQQAVSRWQLLVLYGLLNSIDTLDQKEVVSKASRLPVHLRSSHHTSYQINSSSSKKGIFPSLLFSHIISILFDMSCYWPQAREQRINGVRKHKLTNTRGHKINAYKPLMILILSLFFSFLSSSFTPQLCFIDTSAEMTATIVATIIDKPIVLETPQSREEHKVRNERSLLELHLFSLARNRCLLATCPSKLPRIPSLHLPRRQEKCK